MEWMSPSKPPFSKHSPIPRPGSTFHSKRLGRFDLYAI